MSTPVKQIKLSNVLSEIIDKTEVDGKYRVLTSSQSGIVSQEDYFNKKVASRDTSGYKIIRKGQFTYRAMSDTGRFYINRLDDYDIGIVSPAYPVFEIKDNNEVSSDYLTAFFKSEKFQSDIAHMYTGSTRASLKFKNLRDVVINVPDKEEQKKRLNVLRIIDRGLSILGEIENKLDNSVKSRFIEMFGDPIDNTLEWAEATIGELATDVKYGTSNPAVDGGKYPYLRMNNITYDGHLDLSDLKYIDVSEDELEKCVVRKGDILFNRTNSLELVGKTAVFDQPGEMIIAGYIIRVRLKESLLPEILAQFLNLDPLKLLLRSKAKGAVNQANINAQELQSVKVYIPEMSLQKKFLEFKEEIDKSKLAVQEMKNKMEILKASVMQEYFC